MSNPNLTYNQFVAFLLLFAANADLEISENEIAHIQERVGTEDYGIAKKHFDELNDSEVIAIIMDYKEKYYPSPEERSNLLAEIKGVFNSDHDFSAIEREIMMVIKKLL